MFHRMFIICDFEQFLEKIFHKSYLFTDDND